MFVLQGIYLIAALYGMLLLLQLPLLAAAVRRRVPHDEIYSPRGSLHLIPVFYLLFKHDFFSMCPLAVLSQFQRRILHLYSISYIFDRYHWQARSQGDR